MVSTVSNSRLISAQLALRVLQNGTSNEIENSSKAQLDRPLQANSNITTGTVRTANTMANMLDVFAGLPPLASGLHGTPTPIPPLDTNSSSFRDFLKGQLENISTESGPYAKAALTALSDGTMTIQSPSVAASDMQINDNSGNTVGYEMVADGATWEQFLKANMAQDSNGNFVRNADGSFVDKSTGNSADFGQTGGNFYYFTWPQK